MFQPYVLGKKLNVPEKGTIVALHYRGIPVREIPAQDARLLMTIAAKPITTPQELKGNK